MAALALALETVAQTTVVEHEDHRTAIWVLEEVARLGDNVEQEVHWMGAAAQILEHAAAEGDIQLYDCTVALAIPIPGSS